MKKIFKSTILLFVFLFSSCVNNPVENTVTQIGIAPSETPVINPSEEPTLTFTPIPATTPVAYALTELENPRFRLLNNFPGITSNDPNYTYLNIAAGPDRIVLMYDNGAEIRTKQGELITSSNFVGLFDGDLTDTRATYDWYAKKFYLLGWNWVYNPSCQLGECVSDIYLAISKDASPKTLSKDDWSVFTIDGTLMDGLPTVNSVDYTMLGFNEEYITITAHSVTFASDTFASTSIENLGDRIWLLRKQDLPNEGQITNWVEFAHIVDPLVDEPGDQFAGRAPFNLHPALHLTPSDTFFLISQAGWGCSFTIWGIENGATLSAEIAKSPGTCKNATNAQQPNDAPPLRNPNTPKILNPPFYNNGFLWVTHNIGVKNNGKDVSAIRWAQIDVSQWPENVHIIQEGLIEQENTWLMHPAIAVNKRNDMMIVFGETGPDLYPSLFFAGRKADDPPGSIQPISLLKLGGYSVNMKNAEDQEEVTRYAGYFGISLDPADESVWMFGEYGGAENLHMTQIGHADWETMLPTLQEFTKENVINDQSFDIADAQFVTRQDQEYSEYVSRGINIKVSLVNLDVGVLSPEELSAPAFCGNCSGWENAGIREGKNIVILHFTKLPKGENVIQINAFGKTREITVNYDPSSHRVR